MMTREESKPTWPGKVGLEIRTKGKGGMEAMSTVFKIELEIADNWIADGFAPTDQSITDALRVLLPYATEYEIAASVDKGRTYKGKPVFHYESSTQGGQKR